MSLNLFADDCPFCGEVPTVTTDPDKTHGFVECETEDCIMYGPVWKLEQWNVRDESVWDEV